MATKSRVPHNHKIDTRKTKCKVCGRSTWQIYDLKEYTCETPDEGFPNRYRYWSLTPLGKKEAAERFEMGLRIANGWCKRRPKLDKEDYRSEALLAVCHAVAKYNPSRWNDLDTHVLVTVTFRLRDKFRKEFGRRKGLTFEDQEGQASIGFTWATNAKIFTVDGDPVLLGDMEDSQNSVNRVDDSEYIEWLLSLDSKSHEANSSMRLAFVDGLDTWQIAKILGWRHRAAVTNNMKRSISRIKEALRAKGVACAL